MNDIAIASETPAPHGDRTACRACGAAQREGRLTLRWLWRRAREDVAGLERGLLPTVWHLLVAPRRVVETYLQGAPPRYYGPFKYFLIVTALSLLLPGMPLIDRMLAGAFARQPELFADDAAALAWVQTWNALLYAPLVLLLALALRGFFRHRALNLAEHVVIALYGWAQMLLVAACSFALAGLLRDTGLPVVLRAPLALAGFVYWVWYAVQVLRVRGFADWVRLLAALPGAFALFLLAALAAAGIAAQLAPAWRALAG